MPAASDLRHYHVYGGPEANTIASVHLRATTYSTRDARRRNSRDYVYVLVARPDGGSAFVPLSDIDLRKAHASCSNEPSSTEAETLSAEMERRGLKA